MLFNDRVTLADFHRGGKNCSYFAVAPLEVAQQKLNALLVEVREQLLQEASASGDADAPALPLRPWQKTSPDRASGAVSPRAQGPAPDAVKAEVKQEVKQEVKPE